MDSYFKSPYDEDLTYYLYLEYEDGDDSVLNELIAQIMPLIRKAFLYEVGGRESDRGELEANALEEVFRVVRGKSLPEHPKAFSKFLNTVIIRSLRDSLNRLTPEKFEFWRVCRYPATNSFPTHADIDAKLQHEDLLENIRKDVRSKIRFVGREKDACVFMLDSYLGFNRLDPRMARSRFRIFNTLRLAYLQRYIEIHVKAAAWEVFRHAGKDGPLTFEWETGGSVLCPPD